MKSDAEFDAACAAAMYEPIITLYKVMGDAQRNAIQSVAETEKRRRIAAEQDAEHWKLRALYAEGRLLNFAKDGK